MDKLIQKAWQARRFAKANKTKVGCAIKLSSGQIVTGQNFVGSFGTDIHAEVCALAKTIELNLSIVEIAIVAEVNMFTPCGACMDWLMKYCHKDCRIIIDNKKLLTTFSLQQLMPFYPRK